MRRPAADGMPKARIAAELGISRTRVIEAVSSDAAPPYERKPGRRRSPLSSRRCGHCWTRCRTCRPRCWPSGWAEGLDPVASRQRAATGSSTSADRPGRPDHLAARGCRPVRLVVPAPEEIPLEDGTARLLPVLVITAAHAPVHERADDPDSEDRRPAVGSWEPLQQLGRVPRQLIWNNEAGIGRGHRRAEGVTAFMGSGPPSWCCCRRRIPDLRAWWNAATAGSRPR